MITDEIIQALTTFSPRFPREALSEVAEHREELIPLLLDSLDYVDENIVEDNSLLRVDRADEPEV